MTLLILPEKRGRVRNCHLCGSHFHGHRWQRWCRVCFRWRMVGWHIQAAQRALRARQ
jgi:hypothetical protein